MCELRVQYMIYYVTRHVKTSHFSPNPSKNIADVLVEILSGEFAALTLDEDSISGEVKEGMYYKKC